MKATETTIAEVKKVFGVFYALEANDGFLGEKARQTSVDFRRILYSDFLLTFDEKVNFHYQVLTGQFKQKGGYVKATERLYNQYAQWHDDNDRYCNTLDDLKLSVFNEYQGIFEYFMKQNENSFIFRILKKEGWRKNLLLKTDIGQKVNFLMTQSEALKGKTCDDLVKVRLTAEYSSDNTAVIVPAGFERFANAAMVDAYVIYKDKMLPVQTYLHSMRFDARAEVLNMKFETPEGCGFNFHTFTLKDGKFVFDDGVLFFEKQDAYNVARLLIEYEQKRLDEMRAQLETV